MTEFVLHSKLKGDTTFITDWSLSQVRLMDDARFPWLILVPRHPNVVDLCDLSIGDRGTLIEEIARAGNALKVAAGAVKINVGALGNLVPQLHIHVVARNPGDPAWPGPVWGKGQPISYDQASRERLLGLLWPHLA